VAFVDPATISVVTTVAMTGGAHGLALVTGIDDNKLYVTSGAADEPVYEEVAIAGDAAKNGPVSLNKNPLPAPGTWVAYDAASQQVHILGHAPDGDGWTVYVIEPHGRAVYADARLPDGFVPSAWASDIEPDYPSTDRQQLLLFDGEGASASINLGSHAFAWRLPGVIAGVITAALLYLLARILFRRRLVAVLVGLFVLADGMFFVQARIGMNDIYVGLFIVAAYTLFAAIWTGWWRGRAAVWLGIPIVGLLLGLALASKWVAAYAIGALVLLILIRSALGRVLAILGLIGITSVLGYMAISVPEGSGLGNLTFLLIMITLTLLAVVVAVMHPIAWTDEELRFAVGAPVVAATVVFFGTVATGRIQTVYAFGPLSFTPLLVAIALGLGSLIVAGLFWAAGRIGFGPLAAPPGPDDPAALLPPPDPAPEGWLRPGWLLGLPVVWVAASLLALPLVVYVISYIPWAFVENHQLFPGWPPGHTGQTLLDLTGEMYRYHNGLTAAHPASSPWWAWPMNLKPVWFYQESLGAGTAAALYDAGSLVIWWMGIPAIAFTGWMAYKRRSPALALIAVGFAAQWIPWARIDRAAFQYHYYTALPFVVLGLAYFMAELWHGASRHVWLLARAAGAIAIVAPAALWVLDRPLCAVVGVNSVNPNSAACPAVIPDFVLTARTAALAVIAVVGLLILAWRFVQLSAGEEGETDTSELTRGYLSLALTGLVVAGALFIASFLPETAILNLTNLPVEPIAILAMVPLGYLALQVYASRDARRYVIGFVAAAVGWFTILYPNISALPLPAAVVNAYQGILPTYLYAFQFPVSTVDRNKTIPILTTNLLALTVVLVLACLVFAYSAWVWRLTLAESAAEAAAAKSGDPEGLARSEGA
jgi:predicted membrane-bound dolichyl-phosphate-mannose-protein mannosyltransferase